MYLDTQEYQKFARVLTDCYGQKLRTITFDPGYMVILLPCGEPIYLEKHFDPLVGLYTRASTYPDLLKLYQQLIFTN